MKKLPFRFAVIAAVLITNPVFNVAHASNAVWTCTLSGQTDPAVVLSSNPAGGENGYLLIINSKVVSDKFGFPIPYFSTGKREVTPNTYILQDGEFGPMLYFAPDSGGMKLSRAYRNRETAKLVVGEPSWFFAPGECR